MCSTAQYYNQIPSIPRPHDKQFAARIQPPSKWLLSKSQEQPDSRQYIFIQNPKEMHNTTTYITDIMHVFHHNSFSFHRKSKRMFHNSTMTPAKILLDAKHPCRREQPKKANQISMESTNWDWPGFCLEFGG